MSKLTLHSLGRKLAEKRDGIGLRETAKEIGVSTATLSRVERGHLPDLETFRRICEWLRIDPGEVLGVKAPISHRQAVSVHFRKDHAVKEETAAALAQLILAAARAMNAQNRDR